MGLYEQIRKIAKLKGYSINKLEQELGFARSSINKFNKNKPSIDKLKQIADFLDVSVDYLTTVDDSTPKNVISLFEGPKVFEEGLRRSYVKEFRQDIEQILDEILSEQQKEEFNKKINERLSGDPAYQQTTIAAHFTGDDYTEDELDEIRQFAEFVKNRKTK